MPLSAYADAPSRATQPSFLILGLTRGGQVFRPSDWADRLCGIMSQFQPPGVIPDRLSYSPYVMPSMKDGQRCVTVDGQIHAIEPLAYKFLLNFVRDNDLQTEPPNMVQSSPPTAI